MESQTNNCEQLVIPVVAFVNFSKKG